jgi:predicted aspartyl protease
MISNHLLRARCLLWVCSATLGLVIELAATSHGAFARPAPQFEALPLVRSRQNHLLLRAFINGKPAWLTVDSGAPVSAIALNRREHFRLKPITSESSLPARVQINGAFNNVAIARELRIGGLSRVDEPVVTVDLGG